MLLAPATVGFLTYAPEQERRRPSLFETKEQRGRFLAVVGLLLLMSGEVLSVVNRNAADDKAAERTSEIRRALESGRGESNPRSQLGKLTGGGS